MLRLTTPLCLSTLLLTACATEPTPEQEAPDAVERVDFGTLSPTEQVDWVADRYYDYLMEYQPESAYFAGIEPPDHDRLGDNRAIAYIEAADAEDSMWLRMRRIDTDALVGTPQWVTLAYLAQRIGADRALRVCRNEVWGVNQMSGWQLGYAEVAQRQPVGTADLREQALTRWRAFPGWIDEEIVNLKRGLVLGYSSPKPVVQRVINQLDGILALAPVDSPFYSPAARSDDAAFQAEFEALVRDEIHPAIQRYRDYLADEYMERAREELTILANPQGRACYEASLQSYTTLSRSPEDVFALGEETVLRNMMEVERLGEEAYQVDDFATTLRLAKADPDDRFTDKDELLAFAKRKVEEAGAEMPNWVGNMPTTPVEVVPFLEHEEGTGRSAHYNPASGDRPGEYRIPLFEPEEQSKGGTEITAFHETWPGHHLQVAVSQEIDGLHPVTQLIWFSGPGEGWARYSESLAEEMGLYETTTAPILRRAWPARGMVVDPGIHIMGWTREQARDYLAESGRFSDQRMDDMVDRIAILPGQLTAYDSGGLEIMALRREAEAALGDDFDIRAFHDAVLENGTVPLPALRAHIERWIAEQLQDG